MPHKKGHEKEKDKTKPPKKPDAQSQAVIDRFPNQFTKEGKPVSQNVQASSVGKTQARIDEQLKETKARFEAEPENLRPTAQQITQEGINRANTLREQNQPKADEPITFSEDQGVFLNAAGIAKNIPLVGSAFKLGGKLAVSGLGVFGIGTKAERDAASAWWGGRVTMGDVIGTLVFVSTLGIATALTSVFAPNVARYLGIGILRKEGAKVATKTIGKAALDTKNATTFTIKHQGIIRATNIKNNALNVTTKGAEKISSNLSKLNRTEIRLLARRGLAFIKKRPVLALTAHQTATITTAWFAADNMATMVSLTTRDISSQVRFGNITREAALQELDIAQGDLNEARWLMRAFAFSNPITYGLWYGAESTANAIDRNIERERQILGG